MREKLIELLGNKATCIELGIKGCAECRYEMVEDCCTHAMADHLIANGVTIQRWIPVSEPPEENGYYWCYVLTSCICDKKVYEQMPLYWEDDVWLYRHNSYRMCKNITHWMPLPEAPKAERKKADLPNISKDTLNALDRMGANAHREENQ